MRSVAASLAAILLMACAGQVSADVWGVKSQAFDPIVSGTPAVLYHFREDGSGITSVGAVTLGGIQIDVDGLAISQDSTLYGFQMTAQGSRLITINNTTAVSEAVGPLLAGRDIRGAVISASGSLLALDAANNQLVEVSLRTGTEVGSAKALTYNGQPFNLSDATDIAERPDGVFLTCFPDGSLYSLETGTGALSLLYTDHDGLLNFAGLAFSASATSVDSLFAYEVNGNDDIFAYDTGGTYARELLYPAVISPFNAGRGDLAAWAFSSPVLTLSPTTVQIGQTLTVTANAPGATAVRLRCDGVASGFPDLSMARSDASTFTLSFPTSFLAFARGSTVTFTAYGTIAGGATTSGSAILRIRDVEQPPPASLYLDTDDTNTFGLADSTYEPLVELSDRLEAKLLMTHDLNLWFHLQTSASGGAVAEEPTGLSVAEILGRWRLANPNGTIAWRGVFYGPDESVTMKLCFDTEGYLMTVLEIVLNVVPDASGVSPASLAALLPDLRKIEAIYSAANAFIPKPTSAWGWTCAISNSARALRNIATDDKQLTKLAELLARVGIHKSKDALKGAFMVLKAYDLVKIVGSEIVYMLQAKGDDLGCTFTSHRSSSGSIGVTESPVAAATLYRTKAASVGSDTPALSVAASVVPSNQDWLVSYNVTDYGASPVWSWTLYYNKESGFPIQITSPPGWSYRLDYEQGAITWFTQESETGWPIGNFGPNTIAAGGSLAGFSIRHSAPPGYTLSSSVDATYAPSFSETLAPGGTGSVSEVKSRLDSMPKVISDRVVSATLPGRFYVTDPNRNCGICVTGSTTPVAKGDVVRITGSEVEVDGEMAIQASSVLVTSHIDAPTPLGMNLRILGGGPAGLQGAVSDSSGVNNIGLLVRVWGQVTEVEPVTAPLLPTWFKTDDGSGLNVRCDLPPEVTAPELHAFVQVTGVSSCYTDGADLRRLLRVREQSDIVRLQ